MQDKEQKISPIKQRILQFAETLNISKRDFYKTIGVSRGTLESKTGITEDIVAKFIATYPEISVEWLVTGEGNIFKTKIPENVRDENPNEDPNKNPNKRKFQKTLGNKQYKIIGNTPSVAADPPTPYLDSQPQQGKGRIIDSSYLEIEIPPERRGIRNMFSGFTDEEIEKAMSEEFVNNVLEMFKTGEAVSPSTMKDTINEIVKQKDAEINELRAKLWQYESTFGSISPGDNKPPALHVDNSDKRNPDK